MKLNSQIVLIIIVAIIIAIILGYTLSRPRVQETFENDLSDEKLNDILSIVRESVDFRDYIEKLNQGRHFESNIAKLNTFVLLKEFDKQNLLTKNIVKAYL